MVRVSRLVGGFSRARPPASIYPRHPVLSSPLSSPPSSPMPCSLVGLVGASEVSQVVPKALFLTDVAARWHFAKDPVFGEGKTIEKLGQDDETKEKEDEDVPDESVVRCRAGTRSLW